MLILVFGGAIAVVELCVLGLHETQRNRSSINNRQLQNARCRNSLRTESDVELAPLFPVPRKTDSRETLDMLGLLTTVQPGSGGTDLEGRVM